MKLFLLTTGITLLLCSVSHGLTEKMCHEAKLCLHDGIKQCGQAANGRMRQFLDNCDMLEYNCIHNTDFTKSRSKQCFLLRPLEAKKKLRVNKKTQQHPQRSL